MHEIDRNWKVGELARATGLTIRALHHYDEIGLLVPARSESGHRVYSGADVERLYRILALRRLGMALEQIATALQADGESLIETVRRHVALVQREIEHQRRLLARLQEMLGSLERSAAPTVDALIGTVEAMSVVEATIEDVVTREPSEATFELRAPCVVLLREAGGERILPIWIGEPEAAALVIKRRGDQLPRPMGPDLMVALLDAVGAGVERVVIERLDDNTFFATVTVALDGERHEVDARPSDALNLALRARAPIQVASELIDEAGITTWPDALPTAADGPQWTSLGSGGSAPARRSAVGAGSPALLRRAAEQARALGHGEVFACDLLLGILAEDADPASRLLARHGVTLRTAREAIARRGLDAAPASEAITRRGLDVAPASEPGERIVLTRCAMFTMRRACFDVGRRSAPPSAARRELERGHLRPPDPEPLHVLLALLYSPDAAGIVGLNGDALRALLADVRAALDA